MVICVLSLLSVEVVNCVFASMRRIHVRRFACMPIRRPVAYCCHKEPGFTLEIREGSGRMHNARKWWVV